MGKTFANIILGSFIMKILLSRYHAIIQDTYVHPFLKHQRKRFLVFNCSYYGSFIKKISEMDHLKQAVISRN